MSQAPKAAYRLGASGEFIIEGYNAAKPFASFFPGIAGPHGIPMWLFYVNRGQCVCSMGVEDKEHPILEFLSANRAYQLASTQGFRTFVKILGGRAPRFYEPFQDHLPDRGMNRSQRMIIRPARLTLEEVNRTLGLRFEVEYFNVPEDAYAGLVRVLRIENIGRRAARIEVLDGLSQIIPFGVDNYNLKNMRRLVESFVEVVNLREHGVPFFKGKVKQEDRPEVVRIKEGNFYLGFTESARGPVRVGPVVDPQWIFGSQTDLSFPERFVAHTPFRVMGEEILENRLPCAMGHVSATISAGKTCTYYSIIGQCRSVQALNRLVPAIARHSYVEKKKEENDALVDRLTDNSFVHSASRAFDLYARQNFLDNVLRGGFPVSLRSGKTATTVHLYSRKHGDLERDYNDYRLSATKYSQGNGNFRDINQNRRSDLFFNPDVREDNVEHFCNLIQLDGFNPLVVKPTAFRVRNARHLAAVLRRALGKKDAAALEGFMRRRFTPGQLLSFVADRGMRLRVDEDVLLADVLAQCEKYQETDYGHGFWSDHWHYNLDLVENYLAVYPEKLRALLIEKDSFTFFDNPHRVLPREDKYVIWEGRPMQLGAVVHDAEKEALIRTRADSPYEARTDWGRGRIFRTCLLTKLVCLVANKLASLDPFGAGVEMESDKPNWYDALNGLPGQLGSSISETLELKRHVLFILDALDRLGLTDKDVWPVFVELNMLMERLQALLRAHLGGRRMTDFAFWDQASAAREQYRTQTRLGVSGEETRVAIGELRDFLRLALRKVERGIARARDRKTGLVRTYFINQVTAYELITAPGGNGKKKPRTNPRGLPCFRAKKFKQVALPLFLEGPVHDLRVERDPTRARAMARAVRASGLFDRKLRMYKVNESLEKQPMEIGRTKIFSRGWLENESIWLHMEYKYLLE
ncbi:MAG: cellobiose phosphorylase, partial [Kiritimatiellae bacterium]|nr:cellobiose phosphorylase [Kiritimatiellia bacterium]